MSMNLSTDSNSPWNKITKYINDQQYAKQKKGAEVADAINQSLTPQSAILKKSKQCNLFCDLSPNWQRDIADEPTHSWTSQYKQEQ